MKTLYHSILCEWGQSIALKTGWREWREGRYDSVEIQYDSHGPVHKVGFRFRAPLSINFRVQTLIYFRWNSPLLNWWSDLV